MESSATKCVDCGTEVDQWDSFRGRCGKCHALLMKSKVTGKSVEDIKRDDSTQRPAGGADYQNSASEILLTTETTHNLAIEARLGIVSAEVVVGMNVFKDFMAGVRNTVGGRSGVIQDALADMRETALNKVKNDATKLSANAVVGISFSYSEIGATGSTMLMLIVTGTAVKLQD